MAILRFKSGDRTPTAFASPSFRTYIGGSTAASVGEWIDMTVLNWAVLQMTGSPLHLALINACRLVPIFLLSLYAGVLADRFDRRKLLMALLAGIVLLTLVLGWLLATEAPFWLFALVVALRAVLQAMDPPVRGSFVPSLVPRDVMPSAIALSTSAMNLSRILGPACAGFLLGLYAPHLLFHACAALYMMEMFALARIGRRSSEGKQAERPAKPQKASVGEAATFIKKAPNVQSLLLLAVVPMMFGFPYTSMMPLFSTELLGLGPDGFGALLSISAVGALLGSLLLSVGSQERAAGKWLVSSLLGFGASLTLFMVAPNFGSAAAAMFAVGFTSQTYRTMSRITLQLGVPDHLRGRILSIALMDRGFIPLGALLIGAIAEMFGALAGGLVMGAGCLVITLILLAMRPRIWSI